MTFDENKQLQGTKWLYTSDFNRCHILIFYPDNLLFDSGRGYNFQLSSWSIKNGVITVVIGEDKRVVSYTGRVAEPKMTLSVTNKQNKADSQRCFDARLVEKIANFETNQGYLFFRHENYLEAYRFFKPFINDLTISTDEDYPIIYPLYRKCYSVLLDNAYAFYRNNLFTEAVEIFDEIEVYKLCYLECIYSIKFPQSALREAHPLFKQWNSVYTSYWGKEQRREKNKLDYKKFGKINREEIKFTEDEIAIGHLDIRYDIPFGKYKGLEIKSLVESDFSYLCWSIINVLSFCVSPEVLAPLKFREYSLFYQALKINIIKNQLLELWEYESLVAEFAEGPDEEWNDGWDSYSERDMINDAFEGDESNLWNVD